jgi:hypothetical protein
MEEVFTKRPKNNIYMNRTTPISYMLYLANFWSSEFSLSTSTSYWTHFLSHISNKIQKWAAYSS